MRRRGRFDETHDDEQHRQQQQQQQQANSSRHMHHAAAAAAASGYAGAAAAAASSGSVVRPLPSAPRSHIVPSRRRVASPNSRHSPAFAPASAAAAAAYSSRGAGAGSAASSHSHAASSIAAEPVPSPGAERRPAKRVKKEEVAAAAAASSSSAAAPPAPKALHAMHSQHKEDLVCSVCQELPPGEIFQCGEGHLLCKVCHRTILLNPRPICPVCRMRLSRNNPSRNRFAERVKDEMHVPCSNSPCPELIKHADLPKHLASCGYRATKCSFRPLGCDWTGAVNQRGKHEKECPVNTMRPRDLLEHVKARNRKHQQQKEDIRCTGALHAHLCRMLSKRCRDLVVRDLLIEPDPHTGELATHPFRAVGMSWEVVMDRAAAGADSPDVKIHLRIVDRPPRKLVLECFVLSGPDLPFELSPTLRRVVFRKSVGLSESFPLPVTSEQAREIHNRQTLSLRMGFVDCTLGPLTQEFSSVRQGQYALRDDALSDGESSDGASDRERADSPVVYPDEVDDDALDDDLHLSEYMDPEDVAAIREAAMQPADEGEDMEPALAEGEGEGEGEGEPHYAQEQQQQQHHDDDQSDSEQPPQLDDDEEQPPVDEDAAQDLSVYDEGEPEGEAEGEGQSEGGGDPFEGEVEDIDDDDDAEDEDEPQHPAHSAASSSSSSAAAHSSMPAYSQPPAYSRPIASLTPRSYSQR